MLLDVFPAKRVVNYTEHTPNSWVIAAHIRAHGC